jgi:ribonuclease R
VKLHETGADGFVPARTIGDEYFHYDEKSHSMVGRHSGETYRLGDMVKVKLVEAAPVAGALRFEMLSEGRQGRPARHGSHPRERRSAKAHRPKQTKRRHKQRK